MTTKRNNSNLCRSPSVWYLPASDIFRQEIPPSDAVKYLGVQLNRFTSRIQWVWRGKLYIVIKPKSAMAWPLVDDDESPPLTWRVPIYVISRKIWMTLQCRGRDQTLCGRPYYIRTPSLSDWKMRTQKASSEEETVPDKKGRLICGGSWWTPSQDSSVEHCC